MGHATTGGWIMKSIQTKIRVGSLLVGLICIMLFPLISQSDELSRAAMLSYTCAGCHGTNGISPGSIPSIYCKTPEAIQKALTEYRDGTRFSTVMGRHVKGYTDDEIQLIAGFFGTYCNEKIGEKK
jgi:sulfide dehydrogenase cytochrome subunit